jgi:DNA-binding CsgD family transcriptional regulator
MIPKVLYSIGEYLYKDSKYDESIKVFNNVLLKNKSIKEYDLDIKTLKMISMIYKNLQDDKSFSLIINRLNKALEKNIKDKDKIFSDININALKYLSKENDFSLMEENNLKIKFDIETKKRKLTTEALVSFSEREFLKNITTKISSQNLSNNKIIKLCNERMMHTKNWDIFMKLFNDIHPDFNKYIINKSNSITESELRVCNLIKMNFSTIEITEILAITRRGVEQHRYRIKKKLKLKTDLTIFLQSI